MGTRREAMYREKKAREDGKIIQAFWSKVSQECSGATCRQPTRNCTDVIFQVFISRMDIYSCFDGGLHHSGLADPPGHKQLLLFLTPAVCSMKTLLVRALRALLTAAEQQLRAAAGRPGRDALGARLQPGGGADSALGTPLRIPQAHERVWPAVQRDGHERRPLHAALEGRL
jgi:hypothetical protein